MAASLPRQSIADPSSLTGSLQGGDLLTMLCAEQCQRWQAGERVSVESFLEQHPQLGQDSEKLAELVYLEFLLRQERGEMPQTDEYFQRFPQCASQLARKFGHNQTQVSPGPDGPTPHTYLQPAAPSTENAVGETPLPWVTPADSLAFQTTTGRTDLAPAKAEQISIPGYEIMDLLGKGGMGIVFKARHIRLNRLVALKMILAGPYAGDQERARFFAEAEAVARLKHPHVVQIHDIQEHEGRPYLSLELVDGGSLARKIKDSLYPSKETAPLVETMARAMHYAHQQGIVHRDLKPGNVLLGADGTPKISDFGLAKLLDTDSGQTQPEVILGTPSYMAPEQASGRSREAGPAADVYALGAILYELLTGWPPFRGATKLDTLEMVKNQDPVPPSRVQLKVPRDLETICLKCLEKDASRRYPSALALAEDLRNFQEAKPIKARPASVLERGVKWARRRPALAGLIAVLVLAFGGGLVGGAVFMAMLKEREDFANSQVVHMEVDRGMAYVDESDPVGGLLRLVRALEKERGGPRRDEIHRLRIGNVLQSCPRPFQILVHERPKDFGARSVLALVQFSPDSRWVLTATYDAAVRVWDAQTGKLVCPPLEHNDRVLYAAFSPEGKRVVTASRDKTARVWDATNGKSLTPPLAHAAAVDFAVFSPEGARVLTVADSAQVWDAATGRQLTPPLQKRARQAVFSPDGKTVATAGDDRTARIWDAASGQPVGAALTHVTDVYQVRFSPDGSRLLTVTTDDTASLWDLASGKTLLSKLQHTGPIKHADFSPDGTRILIAGANDAQLWDAGTGRRVGQSLQHRGEVLFGAFSPDSQMLVTACGDQTARLWQTATGQAFGSPLKHNGVVHRAVFSPDGRYLATAGEDRTVRLWDTILGQPTPSFFLKEGEVIRHLAWSPDRSRAAIVAGNSGIWVWDVARRETVSPLIRHDGQITHLAFSPDGAKLVTASDNKTAQVWDAVTGKPTTPPLKHGKTVAHVAFSPDSRKVATASNDGTAQVWDAATGEASFPALQHKDGVTAVAFSPDNRFVVTASADKTAQIWDANKGHPVSPPLQHEASVRQAMFSPEGRWVLTVSQEAEARLWNPASGEAVMSLKHMDMVDYACFSPDGRKIVTTSRDHTARLWDAATGQALYLPLKHDSGVVFSEFSADAKWVVTAGADNAARVWDAATGQPITPALKHSQAVVKAYFTPANKRVVTLVNEGRGFAWDLHADQHPLPDLQALGELMAGYRLDRAGGIVPLGAEEAAATLWRLRDKYPDEFISPPETILAWHRLQAWECERTQQWSAAVMHLDPLLQADSDQPELRFRRGRAFVQLSILDKADGDLALARATKDEQRDLWRIKGSELISEGKYQQAVPFLDRALSLKDDFHLRLARGVNHAYLEKWDAAAADFSKCIEWQKDFTQLRDFHLLALAGAGDSPGYRKECLALLAEHGQTDNPDMANWLSWSCSRFHKVALDPAAPLVLARRAAANNPKRDLFLFGLGAALYRAGKFDEAIEKLEAADKVASADAWGISRCWLVLAMAHRKKGHDDEARIWLEKATRWMDQKNKNYATGVPTAEYPWSLKIELDILRKEADELMKENGT